MNEVKAIYISDEIDSDIIDLINRFASAQQLKPTTAIKRYLLRTLPQAIKNELNIRENSNPSMAGKVLPNQINNECQGNSENETHIA